MYNDSSYWSTTALISAALLGLIPAVIAHSKGLSFWKWWFFGTALFIIALPLAILAQPASPLGNYTIIAQTQNERKCPYCAEMIKREAVVCRFCGREVEPLPVPLEPSGPNFGLPDFRSFVANLVSQVSPDSTQSAETHYKRGLSLMKNHQTSEAALAFAQVLRLAPSNDWWNKWAQARLLEIYKSNKANPKRA